MKRQLQAVSRFVHVALAPRSAPNRLGVYLHQLESKDHEAFRELVTELRRIGYRFVDTPDEFLQTSDKVVWLSFDDNYRSWFDSRSLFQELDVRATFFVNTLPLRDRAEAATIREYFDRIDHLGDRTPLSSEELAILATDGHTIGAHTCSHHNLAQLRPDDARTEIRHNRTVLQEIVGRPVDHFAFPFGLPRYFPLALRHWCIDQGFRTIAYATPGMQHAPQVAHSLHRTPWRFDRGIRANVEDLRVDGRLFVRITGRSPVG